jgi:hypothetical protein
MKGLRSAIESDQLDAYVSDLVFLDSSG